MNRIIYLAVLAAFFFVAVDSAAFAKEAKTKTTAPKKDTYAVVQIGDEVRVVRKSELAQLKKTIAEEDKRKAKDYDEAQKNPDMNRGGIELVKPVARKVKILKNSIKSQREAEEQKEKFIDELFDTRGATKQSKTPTNW